MGRPGKMEREGTGNQEEWSRGKIAQKNVEKESREKMAKRKFSVSYWLHNFEEEERLLLRFKWLDILWNSLWYPQNFSRKTLHVTTLSWWCFGKIKVKDSPTCVWKRTEDWDEATSPVTVKEPLSKNTVDLSLKNRMQNPTWVELSGTVLIA